LVTGCTGDAEADRGVGRPATADEVRSAFIAQLGGPMEIEGDVVSATVETVERVKGSVYCIRYREHWESGPAVTLPRGGCW
jgi:hypothetical protein